MSLSQSITKIKIGTVGTNQIIPKGCLILTTFHNILHLCILRTESNYSKKLFDSYYFSQYPTSVYPENRKHRNLVAMRPQLLQMRRRQWAYYFNTQACRSSVIDGRSAHEKCARVPATKIKIPMIEHNGKTSCFIPILTHLYSGLIKH